MKETPLSLAINLLGSAAAVALAAMAAGPGPVIAEPADRRQSDNGFELVVKQDAASTRLRTAFFERARPAVSKLLLETENLVGRKIVFAAVGADEPVVACCIYDVERQEPMIFLRDGWLDVDVAHEVLHLRLDLVEGFGMLAWRRDVARTDAVLAAFGRVQTYVKDEVVHARLAKMGLKLDGEVFRPALFDSVYTDATRYLEEGRDRPNDGMAHLDKLGYGVLCRVCFLLQAELILKNYRDKLAPERVALVEKFIRTFRGHLPEESAGVDKLLKLFKQNDVQTRGGHDEILRAWAKMEDLDKFVGVARYRKDQNSKFTLPFPE